MENDWIWPKEFISDNNFSLRRTKFKMAASGHLENSYLRSSVNMWSKTINDIWKSIEFDPYHSLMALGFICGHMFMFFKLYLSLVGTLWQPPLCKYIVIFIKSLVYHLSSWNQCLLICFHGQGICCLNQFSRRMSHKSSIIHYDYHHYKETLIWG